MKPAATAEETLATLERLDADGAATDTQIAALREEVYRARPDLRPAVLPKRRQGRPTSTLPRGKAPEFGVTTDRQQRTRELAFAFRIFLWDQKACPELSGPDLDVDGRAALVAVAQGRRDSLLAELELLRRECGDAEALNAARAAAESPLPVKALVTRLRRGRRQKGDPGSRRQLVGVLWTAVRAYRQAHPDISDGDVLEALRGVARALEGLYSEAASEKTPKAG